MAVLWCSLSDGSPNAGDELGGHSYRSQNPSLAKSQIIDYLETGKNASIQISSLSWAFLLLPIGTYIEEIFSAKYQFVETEVFLGSSCFYHIKGAILGGCGK